MSMVDENQIPYASRALNAVNQFIKSQGVLEDEIEFAEVLLDISRDLNTQPYEQAKEADALIAQVNQNE